MERQELQRTVDEMYERLDREAFLIMNMIVEEVRANMARTPTLRNLGQVALREQE